jgi:hypothetical protein
LVARRLELTEAPLAVKLGCRLVARCAKVDVAAAMTDALAQNGTVLMVWEHKNDPGACGRRAACAQDARQMAAGAL